jgi:cytochrome c-type biogenesis protein CcmF
LLSWKRGDLPAALSRLKFALGATVVTIVATLAVAGIGSRNVWAAIGLGLAAWLLAGSFTEWAGRVHLFRNSLADSLHRAIHLPRSAWGMTISHIGLAIVLMGVAGSLAWRAEYLKVMHPGDTASISGYQVRFIGVEDNVQGPNYVAVRGRFIATKNGRYIQELDPERRQYANPQQSLSTVAIHTNFVNDLYVVLGDPDANGGFIVHIFHNPLIPLLFFGAIVMVLGGIVSLTDRHHRIGAPLRRLARSPRPAFALSAAVPITVAAPAPVKRTAGWKHLVPLAGFTALVGFLLVRLYLVEQGFAPNFIPSVMINRATPGFDLDPLIAGQPGLSSAGLKGHLTLVNFFASWCGPCREEHPILSQLPKGVELVGISYKDRPGDARAWLSELGNPYRTIGIDLHGQTGLNFGVYGVPETYLIDKSGVIRFKRTGPLTPEIIKNELMPVIASLK